LQFYKTANTHCFSPPLVVPLKMVQRRLSAHALLSVVVLSFVVSIMLSAAIALAYTRSAEVLLYRNYTRGYRDMHSAQEYFFALHSKTPLNLTIDLFQTGEDSVQIRSCHWGLWEAAGFKVPVIRNRFIEKSMIYGCFPTDQFKSALWMPHASYGVGLTGSAYIKGDCYIAEGGVRTNVSVPGYASTIANHLEGNSYKCDPSTMTASAQQIQYFSDLLHANWSTVFSATENHATHTSDTIYRSFSEPTLCIMLDNVSVSLSTANIKGNCVLYSAKPLLIPASARLEHVQVIAPTVLIGSGFTGSIHVLATDSILVQQGVVLTYPSSLVLAIATFKINGTNITIENGAKVNGIIYSYQAVPDMQRSVVRIREQALTRGMVYTNGYVELRGKHVGNITTAGFQYKNHDQTLTDVLPFGTIDYKSLSKHFVVPVLTDKTIFYQTACWIEQ